MSPSSSCAGSSSSSGRLETIQSLRLNLDVVTPLPVPPQYAFSAQEKYHGHHATLSEVSLISSCSTSTLSSSEDGAGSCSSRRAIRPLPLPPCPKSAPPVTRRNSTIRPLPSLPTASLPKPDVSISVTPATPMPPPTPHDQVEPLSLSPPSSRRKPKPFTSLSLQTSPDALAPPCCKSNHPSPVSPFIPEAPTPTSARRKRLSKLRRYLGESVPDDMVPYIAAASRNAQSREEVIKRLSYLGSTKESGKVHSLEAVIAKKLMDLRDDDSSSTDDDLDLDTLDFGETAESEVDEYVEAEEKPARQYEDDSWSAHGIPFRAASPKRQSKRWFREKGGHRYEERDLEDIMHALRSL